MIRKAARDIPSLMVSGNKMFIPQDFAKDTVNIRKELRIFVPGWEMLGINVVYLIRPLCEFGKMGLLNLFNILRLFTPFWIYSQSSMEINETTTWP